MKGCVTAVTFEAATTEHPRSRMRNPLNLPAPDWRAPLTGAPVASGWGCACTTCRPRPALPQVVALDAAELFRRHPLAHLELD